MGWLFVGLVILLSLIPSPPTPIVFEGVDKLIHLSIYMVMMLWFGLIYMPGKRYRNLGIGFIMMGIILELIQGIIGYRYLDVFDMTANTLGVLFGWLLVRTPISSALLHLENIGYRCIRSIVGKKSTP
jgi:VanZ family protein